MPEYYNQYQCEVVRRSTAASINFDGLPEGTCYDFYRRCLPNTTVVHIESGGANAGAGGAERPFPWELSKSQRNLDLPR